MAKAKYNTALHRAATAAVRRAQAAGEWLWCNETVCLFPTRLIAPTQAAHVVHDPTGTRLLGAWPHAGHRRCNLAERNRRVRNRPRRLRLI